MKKLSFLALALLAVLSASAQMAAYSVATNVVGEPGEATVIDLQGTVGTDFSGLMIDADGNMEFNSVENAKGFPIGFEFRYNSQKMTHFLIGTDLEIQLSPTETISTDVHKNKSSWFTNSSIHDVIGISPRQGTYGLEDTQISYWIEGTEGYRALCIEYKNIDFQGTYNADNDYCGAKATVQYRLYEQNGNIEMKVKGMKPVNTGSNNFMRLGILGDPNDFLQVQAWDGTVISARDNSISYSVSSYPVDGQVYTFQAPEPCFKPTVSGSDLQLTSTTTQISGTFQIGNGDHYIVLATTEDALTEKPADMTKYQVGDIIGNAKVIAITTAGEFYSPNDLEQGTYNVFVFAFNSMCMDGPLYCNEAISATIALKPGAPASLTVTGTDKNVLSFKAEDSGAQMLIALTDEQGTNPSGQYLTTGAFGEPNGFYQVGDAIEGGGKVIYIGNTTDMTLNDLTAGQAYFLRAWSTDGQGGYSSEYQDANAVTAAELPWEFDLTTAPIGETPIGWTEHEDDVWSMNERAGYFYNQMNMAAESAENINVAWRETHDIYLGEGSNWLSIEIAATEIPFRFATDWTMGDNDKVAIQVTTDGVEYKDILVLTKDNMPEYTDEEGTTNIWKNGVFTPFKVNFSEYAGQKVRVRLYIQRMSKGQVQFKNFKLDGTLYGIVGNIPGLTWDDDIFMTQDKDNKNIYTASLDVEINEIPAEAYEYKLRSNQNWDGYQLPAEGNQYWMPTETGSYTLVFTADLANHQLSLSAQRPYQVSFKNEAGWTNVYAYTWIEDGEGHVIAEPSGAWPGTKVESTFSMMSRKFIYNFSSEQQPQYIIWNNADGYEPYGEEPAQTDNYVFVNGKEYSVYPEITSVALPGNYNGWSTAEISAGDYPNMWQTTIGLTEDTEFKLFVNGNWLGYSDVTIEAPEGWVVEGSENNNLKLMHSVAQKDAYFMVAYWLNPGIDVKEGWLIAVEEGDPGNIPTAISGVSAKTRSNETVFNMKGQRLSQQQRGVNIVNGKKVVRK
jgi:hypothetical protein